MNERVQDEDMFNIVRDYSHGAQYVKDNTGTRQEVKVFPCTVG